MKNEGQLALPLALALGTVIIASIGLLSLLHHWRSMTETQLRLDACVAEKGKMLVGILRTIEDENILIQAARAAIAAGTVTFQAEISAPAQETLQALVQKQDLDQQRWKLTQSLWLGRMDCAQFSDQPDPLPSMSWVRLPPDAIGPQPLTWEPGSSQKLRIQLAHRPRYAAAEIKGDSSYGASWSLQWAPPIPTSMPRTIFN